MTYALQSVTSTVAHSLKNTLEFVHLSMNFMCAHATSMVFDIVNSVNAVLDPANPAYDNGCMRAVIIGAGAGEIIPLHSLMSQFYTQYQKVAALDSAHVIDHQFEVVIIVCCVHNIVCSFDKLVMTSCVFANGYIDTCVQHRLSTLRRSC